MKSEAGPTRQGIDDIFDGYIDPDTGVIGIRIGGPAGARNPVLEWRTLARVALERAGDDADPLFTVQDVGGLRATAGLLGNMGGVYAENVGKMLDLATRLESVLPLRGD